MLQGQEYEKDRENYSDKTYRFHLLEKYFSEKQRCQFYCY